MEDSQSNKSNLADIELSRCESLKGRLLHALNNEFLCDVFFIVGKEGSSADAIGAHRLILSLSSPVFRAMFNGGLAETDGNSVVVPDVEAFAFRAALKYVYSEAIDLYPETVLAVLYTAKKYQLQGLERACEEFLLNCVQPENACLLLSQAILFDENRLKNRCLDMIDKDGKRAFAGEGFTDFNLDLLCSVFERDSLNVKETDLFDAAVRWAEAECKRRELPPTSDYKREALARAFSCIRFPIMTSTEFANGPAKSGLLTEKEGFELFMYYMSNPKPTINFPARRRETWYTLKRKGLCLMKCSDVYGFCSIDNTCLLVDQPVCLRGLGFYGATEEEPTFFEGSVTVLNAAGNKVISSLVSFTSKGSSTTSPYIFCMMFETPFKIRPKTYYTIHVQLVGSDYFIARTRNEVPEEKATTIQTRSGPIRFVFKPSSNDGSHGRIAEVYFDVD